MAAPKVAFIGAGMGSNRLLSAFAPCPRISASPAALITIAAEGEPLGCILSGPELEIRSRGGDRLLVASSVPGESEEARKALGEATLEKIRRILPAIRKPRLRSVGIGQRPMPPDGRPLVGRLPALRNLLIAVAHPGVILAPAVAEAILDQVFEWPAASEPGAETPRP